MTTIFSASSFFRAQVQSDERALLEDISRAKILLNQEEKELAMRPVLP